MALNMPLALVGVSHHTAPVEVRERLAFAPDEARGALEVLRGEAGVREAVLLSTCNRTEVYFFPAHEDRSLRVIEDLFSQKAGPLDRRLGDYLFQQWGDGVVRHLFQVCSGLDSLVTGEAEIQGQVRDAYEQAGAVAVEPSLTGPVMNRLFQMALSVGGQVRSRTSIGEGAASVASVSVELARKIFGSLRGKRVLILGAGQTGELIVEALAREGVEGVTVANRTYERAVELAGRVKGRALTIDQLAEGLRGADIVLASTAAPHNVVSRALFEEVFPGGASRPLLMIDIAIPRDIDPAIGEGSSVFLYNVDDLRRIVDERVRVRETALPEADTIIRAHSSEFTNWYASLEVVPVIRRMRARGDQLREIELARLFRGMEHLSEGDRERVEEFSRRLMNKLLHDPTARLRTEMAGGGGRDLVEAVRFLYGIEDQESTGSEPLSEGTGPEEPSPEPSAHPADSRRSKDE
jgi:glutamyl-tRNA reductase